MEILKDMLSINWYKDSHGNSVRADNYKEADEKLSTLNNCINCMDTIRSSKSKNLLTCDYCYNCVNCVFSMYCHSCNNCKNSKLCRESSGDIEGYANLRCENCYNSEKCVDSKELYGCCACENCIDCEDLVRCTGCEGIKGLKDVENLKAPFIGNPKDYYGDCYGDSTLNIEIDLVLELGLFCFSNNIYKDVLRGSCTFIGDDWSSKYIINEYEIYFDVIDTETATKFTQIIKKEKAKEQQQQNKDTILDAESELEILKVKITRIDKK